MTVQLIVPRRFEDSRGWFSETYHRGRLSDAGVSADFCQDNHSYSAKAGTLRGIHFQRAPNEQAKLVRCTRGRVFDVAVDLRPASPTYKMWVCAVLTAAGGEQLLVPRGYGHGFLTLENDCEVQYKVDSHYAPESDGGVRWDDAQLGIGWPLASVSPSLSPPEFPILSDKDAILPTLAELDLAFSYDGNPLLPLS